MLRRFKIIFIIMIFIALSILIGNILKGKFIKYGDDMVMENNLITLISPISIITDYYENTNKFDNLFIDEDVLVVKPIKKHIYGKSIITTVEITKVYKSKVLKVKDEIDILESYEIIEYTDNTLLEGAFGLNVPINSNNEYIVNIESLYKEGLYGFKSNSYSCYIVSDTYEIVKVNGELNLDSNKKYLPIIFDIEYDIYSNEDGELLFNVDNIQDVIKEMNYKQELILSRIREYLK